MAGLLNRPARCHRSTNLGSHSPHTRPNPSTRPNLWETETEREQPVLLQHRPGAGKAEPLAQPQHGFKPLDGASGRVEGLEAADPRHGPLDPEVVALDPLLEMFGDVMDRHTPHCCR